jgi:glycosyltransferase involved in cell wall biosynthesis
LAEHPSAASPGLVTRLMNGTPNARLGAPTRPPTPGVRVVLDTRPLQAPERAPLAAAYLDGLLGAFDAEPLAGESFAFLLGSDLDDATERYRHLPVVGRRQLPPTRLLRSGALTVDPFLLRGAAVGSAWRAERGGAAGAVYHAVGGGPLPIASGLPVVVTLLDLAPWELPELFQRSVASRFGQRLRAQLLREAAAVIVGSDATAQAARRLLRIRRDRLHVVRLAPRVGFGRGAPDQPDGAADLRHRLGVPGRYLIFTGRFDARLDLDTLLRALAALAAAGRPEGLDAAIPWPPRILLVGASPEDRASIARAAARKGIGEALAYAPALPVEDLAGLVRGARAAILPVVSEAAGLPAIEALASGTPVVASSVGPLPQLIGPAGLLVEPRDADRLAVALATIWADDGVHDGIVVSARERAEADPRTWADVARETREIYAAVGTRATT